jgi:DNA polymerase-1
MSARGFVDYAFNSYGVVFTTSEASHYRDLYFAKYPKLLKWHKDMAVICEMEGGVSNRFGRFRKLPKIYSNSPFERGEAARRAINTPVQGTGSDLLISAATQLNKELKNEGVFIVGTIHDSIVGEFNEEDKDWVVDEIRRIMIHPKVMDDFDVEFKVSLEVDIGVGPWGSK